MLFQDAVRFVSVWVDATDLATELSRVLDGVKHHRRLERAVDRLRLYDDLLVPDCGLMSAGEVGQSSTVVEPVLNIHHLQHVIHTVSVYSGVDPTLNMGVRVSQVKPSNCFSLHPASVTSKHSTIPGS